MRPQSFRISRWSDRRIETSLKIDTNVNFDVEERHEHPLGSESKALKWDGGIGPKGLLNAPISLAPQGAPYDGDSNETILTHYLFKFDSPKYGGQILKLGWTV